MPSELERFREEMIKAFVERLILEGDPTMPTAPFLGMRRQAPEKLK